jgi:hypothetical protein
MQPQEPVIKDPGEVPSTPASAIINDPDIAEAPVDDVYDPASEGPAIVD